MRGTIELNMYSAVRLNSASKSSGPLPHKILMQVAFLAIACVTLVCTAWANMVRSPFEFSDEAKIAASAIISAPPVWNAERFGFAVPVGDITADMGLYTRRSGKIIRSCSTENGCPFAEHIELAAWWETGDPDAVSFAVIYDDTDQNTKDSQSNEPVTAATSSRKLVETAMSQPTSPLLPRPTRNGYLSTDTQTVSPTTTPLPLNPPRWILALAGALLLVVVAVKHLLATRRVRTHLNFFYFQVATIQQQFEQEPKHIDDQVQKVFDGLHDRVRLLLQRKQIRLFHLKQAAKRFHAPGAPTNLKRRTLSELGYALAANQKFRHDTPVLALYKHTGEARTRKGMVADTYTILKEGSSTAFSQGFKAKVQSPFVTPLRPENNVPAARDANEANSADAESEYNVAYILSLLGPIKLMKAHWVESNLNAIAALPHAAEAPAPLLAMSDWANLRSLLTEDIRRIEPALAAATSAMRQQPLLLIAGLAEIDRYQQRDHKQLFFLLGKVATALASSTGETHHISMQALMLTYARVVQSLEPIALDQQIENPGVAYVEARGAEADAGFLMRIANLTATTNPLATHTKCGVLVTTNLTEEAFRARLKGYAEVEPGKEEQTVIAHLLTRLDAGQLTINTVEGSSAISAKSVLAKRMSKNDRCIVLVANPTLLDLSGVEASLSYYLWTLSGQMFRVTGENLRDLIGAAREINLARRGQSIQQPVTAPCAVASEAGRGRTQTNVLAINKSRTLNDLHVPATRPHAVSAVALPDSVIEAGENQLVRTVPVRRVGT